MKRLSVFLTAVFLVFFVGMSLSSAETSMRLRFGDSHAVQHPDTVGLMLFKKLVEKNSHGRITVDVLPNAQLGSEAEMCEQAKMGVITGLIGARFEDMSPKLYGLTLPFLFRDYAQAEKVLNGPIGDRYASYVEAYGLKMLAWTHSGFRQITNNVRPIIKPQDLEGLKIRTPPLETVIRTMKAFGASCTPTAYPEVYMALKTGVVDGQENPYVNIFDGKFFEVQKYLSEVNYIYIPSPFVVGLKWWNSISAEDQAIIGAAAKEAAAKINELTVTGDLEAKETMQKAGIKINVLTDQERQAFIAKAKPVYDYFISKGYIDAATIRQIQETK